MTRVGIGMAALIGALMIGASALAHPGAPGKTVKWAALHTAFRPGKGEFDDKSFRCVGLPPALGKGLYRHFRCVLVSNDGLRSSQMIHTLPGGGWTFSDIKLLNQRSAAHVVATKSISGDFANLVVSATVQDPYVIEAKAIGVPDQYIDVNWNMVCSNGSGAAGKSGSYTDASRVEHKLQMPFPRPTDCTVAVGASLKSTGRLAVQIIKFDWPK